MNQDDKLREAVENVLKKAKEAAALDVQHRKAEEVLQTAKGVLCQAIKATGKGKLVRYGRHEFSVAAQGQQSEALDWTEFYGVMLGPETPDDTPDHPDDCDCERGDELRRLES
ncbi:MAG TPA: hypothetical protein VMY37_04340 [Thermoguttaceae bacterium]|nr:hypothetical protein [Thermoguttaceae bacterium]